MKKIPDKSIDLVLTDPPFNVKLDYKSIDDNLPDEEYSEWCFQWLREANRVLKQGHYAFIFTGDKKLYYVHKAVMKSGLFYHHFLKWHKPYCQRALSGTVFFNRVELAFVCSNGKPNTKLINRKVLYQDYIRVKNTSPSQIGAVDHNARRPEGLYRLIIEGFTQPNDLILDCFLGSGTTGIACKESNRKCLGIEINKDYYEIAQKRINNTMESLF